MPVFLRLIAASLAATGLLGHGIAMLLVGLLASSVAAEPDARYFSEICTAEGIVRLADLESRNADGGGGHHGNPLESCPVCAAYAQIGAADLPVALAAPSLQCCGATLPLSQGGTRHAAAASDAQPRAPPAVA